MSLSNELPRAGQGSRVPFASLIVSLVLVGTGMVTAPAFAADANNPKGTLGASGVGLNVVDNWINNGHQNSHIVGVETKGGVFAGEHLCSDFAKCDPSKIDFFDTILLLPNCATSSDKSCVESIEANVGGAWQKAVSIGQNTGPTVEANPKFNIPKAGGGGLWSVKDPASGNTISLFSHADLSMKYQSNTKKFLADSIAVNIVPYVLDPSMATNATVSEWVDPEGRTRVQNSGFSEDCIWSGATGCGVATGFGAISDLKVTLRVSSSIGGWLIGRVEKPNVSISAIDKTNSRITVAGAVVSVPKIFVEVPKAEGQAAENEAFPGSFSMGGVTNIRANYPNAPGAIDAFRTLAKDRSIGDYTAWSFGSYNDGSYCMRSNKGFQGFVSTNASVYQSNTPQFNSGFLTYQVAGYHFQSDGLTANIGRYDMLMTDKLAKCIYGLKKSPTSATVQVVDDGKTQSIATTVVSMKNGWLKLAAAGFTYSNKTIKVKLKTK